MTEISGYSTKQQCSCTGRETKHVWVKERGRSNFGRPGMWPTLHDNSDSYELDLLSYYLPSVPTGRVLFEIGGVPIREELAREST